MFSKPLPSTDKFCSGLGTLDATAKTSNGRSMRAVGRCKRKFRYSVADRDLRETLRPGTPSGNSSSLGGLVSTCVIVNRGDCATPPIRKRRNGKAASGFRMRTGV